MVNPAIKAGAMKPWPFLVDRVVVTPLPGKQIATAREQVGQQCTLCPAQCSGRPVCTPREGSLVGLCPIETSVARAQPVGPEPGPEGGTP
jgi:hypothetical protein